MIDGYLQYNRKNGKRFLATFEATSADRAFELKYEKDENLMWWDAITVGSLTVLTGMALLHYVEHINLKGDRGWIFLLLSLLTLGFVAAIFKLSTQLWKRYRKIFAIEQFKKYEAQDQWIAVGEDVFGNSENEAFAELKNQCVKNGFGLLVVNNEGIVQPFVQAAQRKIIHGRKQFDLFAQNDLAKGIVGQSRKIGNRLLVAFEHFEENLPWQKNQLFTNLRYKHLFVIVGCWWVLSNIFFNEIRDKDILKTDEETLIAEFDESAFTDPERMESIDTAWVLPYHYKDSLTYYWQQDLFDNIEPKRIDVPNTPPQSYEVETKKKSISKPKKKKKPRDAAFIKAYQINNCDDFKHYKSPSYILQDNSFKSKHSARFRMAQFDAVGVDARLLWIGCFNDTKRNYVIYFNKFYNSEAAAKADVPRMEKLLKSKGVASFEVLARKVR